MMQIVFKHPEFMVPILILLSFSIICQVSMGVLCHKLIWESENMSSTANKSLQQLKLKFSSCCQLHEGMSNIAVFVDKYMNYKEDNTSTQLDLANAKLMSDFVQSLNGVTGGLVVEKVVQAEEEIEQYPELTFSQQGIDFTFKYNAELSSPSLIVLDGEAINKGDSSFEVDLTNFSIQTLLGSIYPANNETLLLAHDNTFDMTVAPLTLQSMSKSWNDFKLYFVVSDDGGHMDLFFGGTQRGAVVEY